MNMRDLTPLQRAVVRQLDCDKDELLPTLRDVANHGADGGFSGFIYYSDTVAFYRKHRAAIVAHLESFAADLGEDVLSLVAGFHCLRDDKLTPAEVGKVLYGRANDSDTYTTVANALAWYALEETARELTDY